MIGNFFIFPLVIKNLLPSLILENTHRMSRVAKGKVYNHSSQWREFFLFWITYMSNR